MGKLIAAALALVASAGAVLAQTGSLPSTPAPSATAPGADKSGEKAAPAEAGRAPKSSVEEAIAECMRLWDAGTHMSKQQWSSTCRRVQFRLENLKVENLDVMGTGVRKKPAGKSQESVNSSSKVN
jgi:hypothetical protein